MRSPGTHGGSCAGFTLLEVLLAVALLSILVSALVGLIDTSLTIWGRTERDRDLQETGTAVLDLLAADLGALEPGPRGDVLGDWAQFDVDFDGIPGLPGARLRLVRQATRADLLLRSLAHAEALEAAGASAGDLDPRREALVEVCWAHLPPARGAQGDERALGVLWRGERLPGDPTTSFFDPAFFAAGRRPLAGSLERVTGGVLWFELAYATPTTVTHDGWEVGEGLADGAASWDARGEGRADADTLYLNDRAAAADPERAEEFSAGGPARASAPSLPRRVRLVLELERPRDLRRRTRLVQAAPAEATELLVGDGERLPEEGGMIRVGEEWMRVRLRGGDRVGVLRGQRGTRPIEHPAGSLVHHGASLVREVVVPTAREEWGR